MPAAQPYNGHRSWNAWNVSLWINSDETLYNLALRKIEDARQRAAARNATRTKEQIADSAACHFILALNENARTPDGAKYTHLAVKLALLGLMEE